jgi:radical SAM family uncharacterized protein/radical SAM-linked protein
MEKYLSHIRKPSRYLSGEFNYIIKKDAEVKIALCFPDTYEVGANHLGISILYNIVNSQKEFSCERVFAPWPDLAQILKKENIPLVSCETKTPLNDFDIVGFSLPSELTYTTILKILELSHIPIMSCDREKLPIIIAGGPGAFNPEPLSNFIDAFCVGDGEELILDILKTHSEIKKENGKRIDYLNAYSKIEGVYVHTINKFVKKRIFQDISKNEISYNTIIPFKTLIHDRPSIEIQRGCLGGCRFCQAGYIYRPLRQKSPQKLVSDLISCAKKTGSEELGLLSLNTCNYTQLNAVLLSVKDFFDQNNISINLPSLRIDSLSKELVNNVLSYRKSGITIAPEAGSERLRKLINKPITDEEIFNILDEMVRYKVPTLKLYFMIGLPQEEDNDIDEITNLIFRIKKYIKDNKSDLNINVGISPFVPKPHTPFQWVKQEDFEILKDKINYLKQTIKAKNLNLKWHDPKVSQVEGLISRGNQKTSDIIKFAYENGSYLDAWSDFFNFDIWDNAIKKSNSNWEDYLKEKDIEKSLSWDYVDTCVDKTWLIKDYKASFENKVVSDCSLNTCYKCGICDKDKKNIIYLENKLETIKIENKKTKENTLRFKYKKLDQAKFLSMLEFERILIWAIRRASFNSSFKIKYSQGFVPKPVISFGQALPTGIESLEEYFDISLLLEEEFSLDKLRFEINENLPKGILIDEVKIKTEKDLPINYPSMYEYKIEFDKTNSKIIQAKSTENIRKKIKETFNLIDEDILKLRIIKERVL